MKRILITLLILFIAVFLGIQLNRDPGYLFIAIDQWTIETTVWFAIFTLLVSFALGHRLLNLLSKIHQLPAKYQTWLNEHHVKAAQAKTRQGLIEFSEGYWAKAKTHLIKALPNADTPLLNYLTAARAAQEMGDHQARDNYLREAQQAMPEAQIAVELTQAQLQLANKQWEQALATLKHLQDVNPKHPYVLKLLMALYQEINDWNALIHLLPELKKHHVLTEQQFDTLYQLAYLQALKRLVKQNQPEQVDHFVHVLPKALRYNAEIIAEYCRYLITHEQTQQAEKILHEQLSKQFNEKLMTLYGLAAYSITQLQFAESLMKKNANSAALFLCLGKISRANQLWGKAKTYLEQSLTINPTAEAYTELGQLYETLDDPTEACTAYRKGLLLVNHANSTFSVR